MSTADNDELAAQRQWSSTGVNAVLALIAGRWVLPILQALDGGPLRRNALRERVGAVSDKVLTDTLRRMEVDSLIQRTAIATVPVEVDYALTPLARTLWPVLRGMEKWAVADRSAPPSNRAISAPPPSIEFFDTTSKTTDPSPRRRP